MRPVRTMRVPAAVTAVLMGVLLTGCGSEAATDAADRSAAGQAGSAQQTSATSAPAEPTAEQSAPEQSEGPLLPPGDPGPDAPSVPDPGKPTEDRDHQEPARTVVPGEALLDAKLASQVLGGDWQQAEARPLECVAGTGWVAQKSVLLDSADGRVLQTVATHDSLAEADRAVAEMGRQLKSCGWDGAADPRLGTASVAATSADGSQTAVVVSAEAVTVTLVGSGRATADRWAWSSLVDVALGSSCAAAPHGCH